MRLRLSLLIQNRTVEDFDKQTSQAKNIARDFQDRIDKVLKGSINKNTKTELVDDFKNALNDIDDNQFTKILKNHFGGKPGSKSKL